MGIQPRRGFHDLRRGFSPQQQQVDVESAEDDFYNLCKGDYSITGANQKA
jgi:hypothetical protein